MAVANIIRESRKSSNHTQKDLANAIGVDTKTIRNVEISGNCSLEVALRLSMYFNRSVNELFFVSDDNPSFCNDKQPLSKRRLPMDKDFQTIAVDFDGTLCYSKWPNLGEPNRPLIDYLINWKEQGNKLILWTCRAGEALDHAISWCHDHNLEFDAVNNNLPEIVEKYGNNSRKVSCDYYIDDRMFLPHI